MLPTFLLIDVEPVAEPLHHHSKVVAMELEVVATDVLEQIIWDYWLNWWNVGMAGCEYGLHHAAYPARRAAELVNRAVTFSWALTVLLHHYKTDSVLAPICHKCCYQGWVKDLIPFSTLSAITFFVRTHTSSISQFQNQGTLSLSNSLNRRSLGAAGRQVGQ